MVGWVLVLEDDDLLAGLRVEVPRCDRQAVARRRNQRDAVAVGAEHAGESVAQALDVGEPVVGRDPPRRRTAGQRLLAGRAHGPQQRRHVRGIHVDDVFGHVEEASLRADRDHGSILADEFRSRPRS